MSIHFPRPDAIATRADEHETGERFAVWSDLARPADQAAAWSRMIRLSSTDVTTDGTLWRAGHVVFSSAPDQCDDHYTVYLAPAPTENRNGFSWVGSVVSTEAGGLPINSSQGAVERRSVFAVASQCYPHEEPIMIRWSINALFWIFGVADGTYPRVGLIPRFFGWKDLPGEPILGGTYRTGGTYTDTVAANLRSGPVASTIWSDPTYAAQCSVLEIADTENARTHALAACGVDPGRGIVRSTYAATLYPRVSTVPWECIQMSSQGAMSVPLRNWSGGVPVYRDYSTLYPTVALEVRDFGTDDCWISENSELSIELEVFDRPSRVWRPYGQS